VHHPLEAALGPAQAARINVQGRVAVHEDVVLEDVVLAGVDAAAAVDVAGDDVSRTIFLPHVIFCPPEGKSNKDESKYPINEALIQRDECVGDVHKTSLLLFLILVILCSL
jgi:hypothetical protein